MSENGPDTHNITLEGEWSLEHIGERQKLLAGELVHLRETTPGVGVVEIDLSGVATIDACGCQLLAIFVETLRQLGITARSKKIPRQLLEKVGILGFSFEFAAQEDAS